MSASGRSPLPGLWFDLFKYDPGMPGYRDARWFQIEAAHFVDPATGEPLVGEREAVGALRVLVRGLRAKLAKRRLAGRVPCRTYSVEIP